MGPSGECTVSRRWFAVIVYTVKMYAAIFWGSWWTFRIVFFFCCSGGKGESEASGGGGGERFFFFIENPRRGGEAREGPRGAEMSTKGFKCKANYIEPLQVVPTSLSRHFSIGWSLVGSLISLIWESFFAFAFVMERHINFPQAFFCKCFCMLGTPASFKEWHACRTELPPKSFFFDAKKTVWKTRKRIR